MPELEVRLRSGDEVVSYAVDGDLKRPGPAIETAREQAIDDGHDDPTLEEVKLAEPV